MGFSEESESKFQNYLAGLWTLRKTRCKTLNTSHYTCPLCPVVFNQINPLKRHLHNIHHWAVLSDYNHAFRHFFFFYFLKKIVLVTGQGIRKKRPASRFKQQNRVLQQPCRNFDVSLDLGNNPKIQSKTLMISCHQFLIYKFQHTSFLDETFSRLMRSIVSWLSS